MPSPAVTKVEDALAARLQSWPELAGWTVLVDQDQSEALAEGTDKTILLSLASHSFDIADENWKTIHTAIFDVEVVSQFQATGTINRTNREVIANIVGAIASDRSMGGRLQDCEEVDAAPTAAIGKDVGSVSLQLYVRFYTPRGDFFTINGVSGADF